jgi:prepilin signal peptidase PulO-like enzyme (type II secretory pathway)
MGDAKLMAVVAVALPLIPLLVVVAAGAALTVLMGLVSRHRNGREGPLLPLGPGILLGFWVALVAL